MSDDKKQKHRFRNIEEKHRCHQNIDTKNIDVSDVDVPSLFLILKPKLTSISQNALTHIF